MTHELPLILYIDDNRDNLLLVERLLARSYKVVTAENGQDGLRAAAEDKPALILLDIMMPEMDGYEVCQVLQANSETAYIPVVFLTALGGERDKARAFAVGGADYLVKPIRKNLLLEMIEKHLQTNSNWKQLQKGEVAWQEKVQPSDFIRFKEFLCNEAKLASDLRFKISNAVTSGIYEAAEGLGIAQESTAQYIARYTGLPYVAHINPEDIRLGVLPAAFCSSNSVVAVKSAEDEDGFILSNPFDLELIDTLLNLFGADQSSRIMVTHPRNVQALLGSDEVTVKDDPHKKFRLPHEKKPGSESLPQQQKAAQENPVVRITSRILNSAVQERASDIHIEPKENDTKIRFRIDGDLRNAFSLKPKSGIMVISRLKITAGMDIAEKRKPQDGGFVADLAGRTFNLRLSTTSTPYGESMVIRLLEPYAEPKKLQELGMLPGQARTMVRVANKSNGIILIVGATGSGKTTTIYSLLHNVDHDKRSLMSVEDPVEYRMPFVNQQQVNEKAGVTFDALLKTAVRQDPDVLFMGEIRDTFSARIAIDFASTGHLTISTLHTSNATSAIFRLDRLGVDRGIMSSALLAVVAQKLVKKLCPHCREIVPISPEEEEIFKPFTRDIPNRVARPVGCEKCANTGYLGRVGVYEVLEFDPEVSELVSSGAQVIDIREFLRERGDCLISTHAIQKAREFIVSPEDIYRTVLTEELTGSEISSHAEHASGNKDAVDEDFADIQEVSIPVSPVEEPPVQPDLETAGEKEGSPSILVVEDDINTRRLITRFLENEGYRVFPAADGVEALLQLGSRQFDLILSDVDMPNLNGFKLLEMVRQKGLESPVILLTSRSEPEDEERGLKLGAMDYIHKPFRKEILILRVGRTIQGRKR